jgi:HEAT repeat protein
MVRFFCPGCWRDFGDDFDRCPKCGLDVRQFWASKDYVELLVVALHHPEKSTPIRAASILGKLKDPRAVKPLIDLIETTQDVYLIVEAVKALGEIGTDEAITSLEALRKHRARMVRDAVRWVLDRIAAEPSRRENKKQARENSLRTIGS